MYKTVLLLSSYFFLLVSRMLPAIEIHSSAETLYKISEIISKKEKGAYLRFGDGDLLLAHGQEDCCQATTSLLKDEMTEALALNHPNILKCLPLHCAELKGLEEGMFEGNHLRSLEDCLLMLNLAEPMWGAEIDEIYSPTALAHAVTANLNLCIDFLKFLKRSQCCLLVGNAEISPYIRNLLFGPQCQFVATPSRNAYNEIDRIEQECLAKLQQASGYKIIITSMGCSGRALQKRLWNRLDDIFLFDFGSLMDAICGINTRHWMVVTHFNFGDFFRKLERELNNDQLK